MNVQKVCSYRPADFSQHSSEAKESFYSHFKTGNMILRLILEWEVTLCASLRKRKSKNYVAFWNWTLSLDACHVLVPPILTAVTSIPVFLKVRDISNFLPIRGKISWVSLNSRNIVLLTQLFFITEMGQGILSYKQIDSRLGRCDTLFQEGQQ